MNGRQGTYEPCAGSDKSLRHCPVRGSRADGDQATRAVGSERFKSPSQVFFLAKTKSNRGRGTAQPCSVSILDPQFVNHARGKAHGMMEYLELGDLGIQSGIRPRSPEKFRVFLRGSKGMTSMVSAGVLGLTFSGITSATPSRI